MMYLKDYNLSDNDLDEIYNALSDDDWVFITSKKYRIMDTLNYLKSLGFTNFKDLLLYKTNMLYWDLDILEKNVKSSDETNLIEKLNLDVSNFDLLFE